MKYIEKIFFYIIMLFITPCKSIIIKQILNKQIPIILTHGMGGTILLNNKNKTVYPPTLYQFIFENKKWKNEILNYDLLHTMEFGNKKALELNSISYFYKNTNNYNELLKLNNIFPISYDFRKIHLIEYLENEFFKQVKTYIESFSSPIILLNHSTGGILMHYFLYKQTKEWKKKHIQSIINISVPFNGTFLVLKLLIKPNFIDKLIGNDILRKIGGIILNMPRYHPYNETDYFDIFNLFDIKKHYFNNLPLFNSLHYSTGINTFNIYSLNKLTPISLDKTNKYIFENGDGVVSESRLLFPKKWKNQKNIFYHNIKNKSHSNILKSDELIDFIQSISNK